MPVYNGGDFVADAIESVLAQSFDDFVLVISDNASTDATTSICAAYAARDRRIHYERLARNLGAVPNYNRVLDIARRDYGAEYFKWVAHDDVCAPAFVEQCLHALERNRDAVVAYPLTMLIDADGYELVGLADEPARASAATPAERFRDLLLHEVWCFPIFGLMRTTHLAGTGGLLPFSSSDKVMLAHLSLLGRFVRIEEHLLLRRTHDAQLSAQPAKSKAAWAVSGRAHKLPLPVLALKGYLNATRRVGLPAHQRRQCYLACLELCFQKDKFRKAFRPGVYNYFGWTGRRPADPFGHLNLTRGALVAPRVTG